MNSYMNSNLYQIMLIYLSFLILINISHSTPLSLCTKGTFSYIKDSSINSKTCSLSTDLSNTYPAAVNSAFFDSSEKCGVCYEIVGPFGAVKIRVEDSTSDANSDESLPHFKLGEKASFALLGLNNVNDLDESRKISISLRMISCDYSGNLKILTGGDIGDGYSFSCLVLNSNIAVSSIRMKENGGSSFIKLERNSKNYFSYDKGNLISYPIEIRINSITEEIVNITLSSKESDETYETDGNFKNPEGSLYYIDTFKKNKEATAEKCCSVDYSGFSSIYSNGVLNSNYQTENNNCAINGSSSGTIGINFSNNGKYTIKPKMALRADQFISISLSLKADKACRECLFISAIGKNTDNKIQIQNENTIKNFYFTFDDLGVESNTFNGVVLYTKDSTININIEKIELIEDSNAPNTEICLGNQTDFVPVIPPDTKSTTITTSIINENEKIEIKILNISLLNETYILFNSENFSIINNEPIELLFSSSNYTFKTQQCIFNNSNNNYADSFICQIENISNIINGEYAIQTPSENKYHLKENERITINNGILIYHYSKDDTDSSTDLSPINGTDINNEIVIINSVNSTVNPGDNIIFRINPINRIYYNNIDQIILIDNNSENKNALYLKNCKSNSAGINVTSINCVVSKNILKGNYTSLASGQDIKLDQNQKINLTSEINSGGFFSQDMEQTINANMSRTRKRNLKVVLKVLYYNETLKPKDIFPYAINISGIRGIQNIRSGYYINYNSQFQFQNCTMGNYSKNDSQALDGISCNLADYIPAGSYSKLSSEGFDVNPNNKMNLDFPYDFNKSENYLGRGVTPINIDESSSSSKTWIVWVVLACLVAVIGGAFLVVFCIRRKKNKEEDSNVNESGENQINNSNEINLANDNDKNKENKEKKENDDKSNNSASQSQSQSS